MAQRETVETISNDSYTLGRAIEMLRTLTQPDQRSPEVVDWTRRVALDLVAEYDAYHEAERAEILRALQD